MCNCDALSSLEAVYLSVYGGAGSPGVLLARIAEGGVASIERLVYAARKNADTGLVYGAQIYPAPPLDRLCFLTI